jgi:hypothetical protein
MHTLKLAIAKKKKKDVPAGVSFSKLYGVAVGLVCEQRD